MATSLFGRVEWLKLLGPLFAWKIPVESSMRPVVPDVSLWIGSGSDWGQFRGQAPFSLARHRFWRQC